MPKAQRLNESLDDLVVWHWSVRVGCGGVGTRASSSRGMVRRLYPIKVLVSDMVFSLIEVELRRSQCDRPSSRLVDGADWICPQSLAAGIVPRLPIQPIRAKLHSSNGKDAAN